MYFPIGWPKYLSVGQGRKSKLKHVACNRYRMLFAVLTETTISIWHCKPCVEIVCYQRCHSSVAAVGNNDMAEWRQDSSMLAVSTTEGYILIYQLEQDVKGDKGLNLYEYHQTKTNQSDANDAIPALRLTLTANVNYKVQITSLSCVRDDLLVTLKDGKLELLFWESPINKQKSIHISDIMFSVDMQVAEPISTSLCLGNTAPFEEMLQRWQAVENTASDLTCLKYKPQTSSFRDECVIALPTGSHLRAAKNIYPIQAVYSSFLEGFALVLSDGRAALVALSSSELEVHPNDEDDVDFDDSYSEESVAWIAKGIWAPGLHHATCVAINNNYRLLGFGTKRGECCVYAIDDVTRSLVLSHTIALSPTHYPNICNSVGSVMKIDWSPDGRVLALSWAGGGLSIWSVFGACLVCTLASDRAYTYDGSPVVQGIFKSMCWGVEGYHLWMISEMLPSSPTSSDMAEPDEDEGSLGDQIGGDAKSIVYKSKSRSKRLRKKNSSSSKSSGSSTDSSTLDQGQLLLLHFAKSALAMNPCMSNHFHVLLHSEDKIFLSCGEKQIKDSLLTTSETLNSIKKAITTPNKDLTRHNRALSNSNFKTSPRRRSVPVSSSAPLGIGRPNYDRLSSISENESSHAQEEEDIPNEVNGGTAVGNKQWTVIPFPLNYLPSNWPIRFAAVDETCSFLAIAGNFGLAHYTVLTRKWKVFGNVTQEKDLVVTGGLTWWEDFVVVACYDLSEAKDEVRVYPRLTNLDNAFACRRKVRSQILLVNVFRNLLILFTYDCRISIFVISRDPKIQRPMAVLRSLQEISMARFVPYPTLVVSVTMSALHMESATRRSTSTYSSRPARETEVIIVNVAGRLLLLQRSLDEDDGFGLDDAELPISNLDEEQKPMKFTSPVVLASCVENIWTTGHKNRLKVHLTDALWLGCGGAGVRVWLPLFPPRQSRHSSSEGNNPRGLELQLLTARRITLAFSLDNCFPLAVLFNEAVILGVTSETLLYQAMDQQIKSRPNGKLQNSFPYSTIERTSEIYLHQILRQLLRRNLGYHALQIAGTCKNLSCFPHVLELMLHEVLEEEATASEPIPDPLLPTVIKFLEEFPEYLQTVVHCARKTEIALWEYLFNSVGSPRDLFEECFKTNQLQTAASYLIILQNLEQLSVARQDATKLFDQALQSHMWELANDIARFLRAIGDGDASAAPRHPTLLNTNIYPAVAPAPHHSNLTEPDGGFKFSEKERKKSVLMRQYSMAPSYHEMALPLSSPNLAKDASSAPFSTARKLTASRSCPASPPAVISFSGYKASSSKSQGSCSSPTSDYPPSMSGASSRRISSRSFTESYILPTKTSSTSVSSSSIPTSTSVTSSISNTFVTRYSVRHYHQENPVHRPLQHSLSHPLGGGSHSRLKRLSSDKTATSQSKEHAASECAEHYFIDVILARQARKMLANKQMHKLGTFAAYVDFQLVPWLKKERSRAARVDDPISCLKALHSDFDWPYPTLLAPKSNRSSASSGGGDFGHHSQSFSDLQSLQKNFNSMTIPRSTNLTLSPSTRTALGLKSVSNHLSPKRVLTMGEHESGFSTDDEPGSGILTVLPAKDRGSNLTLATTAASEMSEVMSETSYTFDESFASASAEDIHGFLAASVEIDDRRGPPRSEMQLQYLLELFLEALCIEWSLLICIMLKDSSYMARLLRTCRSSSERNEEEEFIPLDTLQRTRDCLVQIDQWAVTECSGYKAVLVGCRDHVQALYDLTNAREVSHAEQQALRAKEHQRIGSSSVTLHSHGSLGNYEDIHKKVKPSLLPNQAVAAKKKLFGPGTAVAKSQYCENTFNGEINCSSDAGSEGAELMRRQGSLESRKRPKTLRTRHNSVPCSPESISYDSETIHSRTPSSPAKINILNQASSSEKNSDSKTAEMEEKVSLKEKREPSLANDAPPSDRTPSKSSVSSDEYTSSTGSAEDDSACTIS